jgi:hypothetical protein
MAVNRRYGILMSTLRQDQIDRIEAGLNKAHAIIEGDPVTWVNADNVETELVCIMSDRWNDDGLVVDGAGLRNVGIRELSFRKELLTEKAVVIDASGHFLINGERWDLAKGDPILEAIVPIAGIQNQLEVRVRRSVELDSTTVVGDWSWGE